MFHGNYQRAGSDLVLRDDDGRTFAVKDYFKYEHPPNLLSPEGAVLTANIVAALAGPMAPGQYAQAAPNSGPPPVGRVEKLTGSATVVRNGVTVELSVGSLVYKGDVVQTGRDSTLGISFTDGTAFNLDGNARMVLNDFVFEPQGQSNSALISLVQGTISFLAGQVAKTGDMRVDTPVATMGIRGTAVLVEIAANNGATKFAVLAELNSAGTTYNGSFVLLDRNNPSIVLATVSQVGVATMVTPTGPLSVLAQQLNLTPAEVQAGLAAVQQILVPIATQALVNPIVPGQGPQDQPPDQNDPNAPQPQASNPSSQITVSVSVIPTVDGLTGTTPMHTTFPTLPTDPGWILPPLPTDTIFDQPITITVNLPQNLPGFFETGGTLTRVAVPSGALTGADNAIAPQLSGDARYLVFQGGSQDGTSSGDIYLYDRLTKTVTAVTHATTGETGQTYSAASISIDGRYVVYQGQSNDDGSSNVYLYDTVTQTTTLVLESAGAAQVSGDGSLIVAEASLGGSGPHLLHVEVAARNGEVINDISADANVWNPGISANGQFVTFWTTAGEIVIDGEHFSVGGNGQAQVYLYDRFNGELQVVSAQEHDITTVAGQPSLLGNADSGTDSVTIEGDGSEHPGTSSAASVSADGRYVAFQSNATNLAGGSGGDTSVTNIWLYDRVTGTLTKISAGTGGADANGDSLMPQVSADGSKVSFISLASNLVAGDTNSQADVFVYDIASHGLVRVSSLASGAQGDGASGYGDALGVFGNFIAFGSTATNLAGADPNGTIADIYLADRSGGTVGLVMDHGGTLLTTVGTLPFTDTDDTHTVTVAPIDTTWGALTASVVTDTTGSNTAGEIGWTYEATGSLAVSLAAFETHVDSFLVTVTDAGGNVLTTTVSVTVIGVNDAPTAQNDVIAPTVPDGWSYNPDTGHYYRYVSADGITWNAAAAQATADGAYLATIGSASENAFVNGLIANDAVVWLGGSDAAQEGTWNWISEPGAPYAVAYTNWYSDEPNDLGGSEDYLQMFGTTGTWNDESGPDVPAKNGSTGFIEEREGFGFSASHWTAISLATLLGNDSDVDHGDVLSLIAVSDSALGAAVSISEGGLIYDPTASATIAALGAGQTLTDTFTYTVRDSYGATSTATVTLTVAGENDAPVAQDDTIVIAPSDYSYNSVNGHWYKVNTDALSWTAAQAAALAAGGYLATITSQQENDFVASLVSAVAPGFYAYIGGSDGGAEGVWQWIDGPEAGQQFWNGGLSGTANVYANWQSGEPNGGTGENYVYVRGTDGGVWADFNGGSEAGLYSVIEISQFLKNTPQVFAAALLTANDTDVDGQTVSFYGFDAAGATSATTAHGGTVSFSGGTITYTPATDYFGPDSFTYTVSDGSGGVSNVATASFTVTAPNAAPQFDAASYAFNAHENAPLGLVIGALPASDADDPSLTYSILSGDPDHLFSIDSSGNLIVAGILNYEAASSYSLTIKVADAVGAFDTASVSVALQDVSEPETATLSSSAGVSISASDYGAFTDGFTLPGAGNVTKPGIPEDRIVFGYDLGDSHFVLNNAPMMNDLDMTPLASASYSDDGVSYFSSIMSAGNGVKLSHTVALGEDANFFTTTIDIFNGGTSEITNVRFMRNFDPDQDSSTLGSSNTFNDVLQNPTGTDTIAVVKATGAISNVPVYLIGPDADWRASAFGIINTASNTDPYVSAAWESPQDPNGTSADIQIALTNKIGTIEAGGHAEISFITTANVATQGANALVGITGADGIDGLGGNDLLFGLAGNDRLVGGSGDDTMYGGSGEDTFAFTANFGNDLITDFEVGTDILEFDQGVFADVASLLAQAADDGHGNVTIAATQDDILTINNVSVAELQQHTANIHIIPVT